MRLEIVDTELCVGCQSCMFACARRFRQPGLSDSRIGVRSSGGMEHGFSVIVCRACKDPPCLRSCPVDALELRVGGGVKLHESLCIGCGNCVDACIVGAVFWNDEKSKPMICVHCAYCVGYCPHGVLSTSKDPEARDAE